MQSPRLHRLIVAIALLVATATQSVASTIGSIGGNVDLTAGKGYTQLGSAVTAPIGDVSIQAQTVNILEARETGTNQSEQKFSQSGMTIAFSNPAIDALSTTANSIQSLSQAAGNTSNDRMKALAAASAVLSAASTAQKVAALANDIDSATSVGVTISLGSSSSDSKSTSTSNTAATSSLAAGGNVNISAMGAGNSSSINLQGVQVTAGKVINLTADNQVNITAASNTVSQASTNSSDSGSIGVGFTVGAKTGYTLNASASQADGKANGVDVTQTNSHLSANNQININSGGDTTIKGGTVAANSVLANVGGNLNIESLQDTSTYASEQKSAGAGVSLCLPPFCFGSSSGSVNIAGANANGNFASVTEQSGIKARDGGFQVTVKGNTDLKGGAITSTQTAIDSNKNSFSTASLTTSDIQNKDSHEASGFSVGLTASGKLGDQSTASTKEDKAAAAKPADKPTAAIGVGQVSGSQASTTQSAISGIAGNATARTDSPTAGLTKAWDGQQLMGDVQAQVQITAAFGKEASKAVGDYAQAQLDKAILNKDQAGIDQWKEGGSSRVALHTLVGGLTGGVNGALGAATSQAAIADIGKLVEGSDLPDGVKKVLIAGAGTVVGAVTGGAAGAATAGNATVNNYLRHEEATRLSKLKADKLTCTYGNCSSAEKIRIDKEIQELQVLDTQRNLALNLACSSGTKVECDAQVTLVTDAALTYKKGSFLPPGSSEASYALDARIRAMNTTLSPAEAKKNLQLLADVFPLTSTPSSLYELITGRTAVTNEEANRYFAAIGVVASLAPGGKLLVTELKEAVAFAKVEGGRVRSLALLLRM